MVKLQFTNESMYILSVNVIYSPFADKVHVHTIYTLWKKDQNFFCGKEELHLQF